MKDHREFCHSKWIIINIPGIQPMAFQLNSNGELKKRSGKIIPSANFDFSKINLNSLPSDNPSQHDESDFDNFDISLPPSPYNEDL